MRATSILPLHRGRAPKWLFGRMVKLAECIVEMVIHEHGVRGLLERLSDPWFFQSLSCVLGYDWHSSGTTTVTCGALKEAIDPGKLGVAVAGGKGKTSRKTPIHIEEHGQTMGLGTYKIEGLKYASRMAAKVDSSLVQDGYQIYHHSFVFDEGGNWIVIQQGINEVQGNARRYQWPLEHNSFIEEPQGSILCDTRINRVLNMTSNISEGNRRASLDISKENPRKLRNMLGEPTPIHQRTLDGWTGTQTPLKSLVMPATINWKAMRAAYDFQPRSYEEFVSLRGVGPSTVRGLSLVAELTLRRGGELAGPREVQLRLRREGRGPLPRGQEGHGRVSGRTEDRHRLVSIEEGATIQGPETPTGVRARHPGGTSQPSRASMITLAKSSGEAPAITVPLPSKKSRTLSLTLSGSQVLSKSSVSRSSRSVSGSMKKSPVTWRKAILPSSSLALALMSFPPGTLYSERPTPPTS